MKRFNKEPAAYVVTHRPTGQFYVGSTSDADRRIGAHLRNLNRGKHPNKNLQSTFTSVDDYDIQVTPALSVDAARDLEQALLDERLADPLCCNSAPGARTPWKGGLPEEHKQAVRDANTGLRRSPETIQRMSEAHTGKPGNHISSVIVDGVHYRSMKDASDKLDVNYNTVVARVKSSSPTWSGWTLKS